MRTIHVLRKPCSEGTVAANVLKWGTGALNVDACRIGTGGERLSCSRADPYHAADGSQRTWNPTSTKGIEREQHSAGRWPANVILQHLDGCRCMGTAKAGLGEGFREARTLGTSRHDGAESYRLKIGVQSAPRGREGETTDNWICVPGCPVAALDRQSGILKSAVAVEIKTSPVHGQFVSNARTVPGVNQHGGEGGASRFFQHVKIKVKE